MVLQTNEIADLADAPGVAGCESGVIPRVSVPAVTSWDQAGLDNGLGPNSPVAPSKSDSESSKNLEVAETDLVAGFPRIASCPTNFQLCYQQFEMDSPPNPTADTIETQNCECRVNGSPTGNELLSKECRSDVYVAVQRIGRSIWLAVGSVLAGSRLLF
ncbi:hypothetical protein Nepgr_017378 [Nepenthes gracilis]|uniref:Uncharacterized protein n=1 Tax=Nepenthes gracilis TaxID=150966 RepID=A0AAD3XS40_NEPGR|nr:hypothetical protein Nepgr_017378 [Nepenthes gracilis]